MAAAEVLRNIRGSVTVAAGAFAEQEVNLALSLESSFLYYVTAIHFSIETLAAMDASCDLEVQVCRQSQAGIIGFGDSSVLWKDGIQTNQTTSGQLVNQLVWHQYPNHPYAVAMPSLFLGAAAVGTGATVTLGMNLEYYPKKVTQKQFWEASQTR